MHATDVDLAALAVKPLTWCRWMTEWPELLKFPLLYLHVLLLPTIVLTRRIHCSRIPSSHGLRMSNWKQTGFRNLLFSSTAFAQGD